MPKHADQLYTEWNPITVEHVELKVLPVNENVVERDALTTYLKLKLHHTSALTLVIQNLTVAHRELASLVNRFSASISGSASVIGPRGAG